MKRACKKKKKRVRCICGRGKLSVRKTTINAVGKAIKYQMSFPISVCGGSLPTHFNKSCEDTFCEGFEKVENMFSLGLAYFLFVRKKNNIFTPFFFFLIFMSSKGKKKKAIWI